jgi:preprotein translocase subunit YajC
METMLLPLLMFAALGALMYFSMKKQKRQAATVRQMQDSLVPGTRVMTTSGLHGTITAVADDTIELEVAPGMRTTWVRAAVREVVVPGPTQDDTLVVDEDTSAPRDIVDADPDTGTSNGGINIRKSNDLN